MYFLIYNFIFSQKFRKTWFQIFLFRFGLIGLFPVCSLEFQLLLKLPWAWALKWLIVGPRSQLGRIGFFPRAKRRRFFLCYFLFEYPPLFFILFFKFYFTSHTSKTLVSVFHFLLGFSNHRRSKTLAPWFKRLHHFEGTFFHQLLFDFYSIFLRFHEWFR